MALLLPLLLPAALPAWTQNVAPARVASVPIAAAAPSLPPAPLPPPLQHIATTPGTRPVYAGLRLGRSAFTVAIEDGPRSFVRTVPALRGRAATEAALWLEAFSRDHGVHVVGAGLAGRAPRSLRNRLWLGSDIVPVSAPLAASAEEAAKQAAARFVEEGGVALAGVRIDGNEVLPSELTGLGPYRRRVAAADYRALREEARRSRGHIAFFSSTPQGGGVALMRHALIRLFRLVGVDAGWYVLDPDLAVFAVTKRKIHNVLHGIAPPGSELTEQDLAALRAWWARQGAKFEDVFRRAATIVIDDYQPSGLIPFIRAANPSARILYRSHIQIRADLVDQAGTPQQRLWDLLWANIRLADRFISHPVASFVPGNVPREKVAYLPATTDFLDGLNKPLSREQTARGLDLFDRQLAAHGQDPLDRSRPHIAQIARFDPSKGIPTVLAAYARLRERLRREGVADDRTPQLVLAGHGAVDDVQGAEVFERTLADIRGRYPRWAGDIKAAPLPHSDQALGAVLQEALFALQLSDAEGFEIKVTEALLKGKPVIGTLTGGIPLQIESGRNGLLVPASDPGAAADAMYRVLTDPKLSRRLRRGAARARPRLSTVHNALRWLRVIRGADPD
ncbi:MAG: glycosyltransferase [Elusimicrobia bacterium]|nr:glycosyltransferase [Elusimicrobiota bacterium]